MDPGTSIVPPAGETESLVENEWMSEPRVAPDVIRTAWRVVRKLSDGPTGGENTHEFTSVLDEAGAHSLHEIGRGLTLLLAGLLSTCAPEEGTDDPPHEDDALSLLFPALMRQLRRHFPEVDPTTYPLLAGVLTAALTGQDALRWRDQQPVPLTRDIGGLTALVWLVRDFIDNAAGTPGTADELVQATFTVDDSHSS